MKVFPLEGAMIFHGNGANGMGSKRKEPTENGLRCQALFPGRPELLLETVLETPALKSQKRSYTEVTFNPLLADSQF